MKGKGWAWFRRPPHLVLLLAVLCASVCLAVGFIRSPRLYPVDHGQYDRMLADCGLTWTEEDLAAGDLQYVTIGVQAVYGILQNGVEQAQIAAHTGIFLRPRVVQEAFVLLLQLLCKSLDLRQILILNILDNSVGVRMLLQLTVRGELNHLLDLRGIVLV